MTAPYWLDDDGDHEALAPAPADRAPPVDVAVVGGGVTGCSCALALAERGLRVRVHDARAVAGGASGRNGGFALRGGAVSYAEAQSMLGSERARALWALSERSLDRMAGLAGDALRRVGSLRLAADEAECRELAAELEQLRADGFEAEWLDVLPAPLAGSFAGALVHPRDGAMNPVRWVRRLARLAAEAGAEFVEGRRVAVADLDVRVGIVVAVDGSTPELLPELRDSVRPVRGQMLATEPLPARLYDRPHYARHGFDYWQQLPDGRLVVGGRRDASLPDEYTGVEETTDVVQTCLDALAADLAGGHGPVRVTHRWAGIWGETPDRIPIAGPVTGRDGVWVAGGYSGHGNVLGFTCGELVARAIAGEAPPELELFDPSRFAVSAPGA